MMRRTDTIRAGVFLAAAFAVLGGFLIQSNAEAASYRRLLALGYQHSFAEMTDQLEGMNAALQKGQYATSPALLSSLCGEVYSRASAAQVALGELPYSNVELEETAAFLSKVGDYAFSVGRQTVQTGAATELERQTLLGLATVSKELTGRMEGLREELNHLPITPETVLQAEARLSAGEEGSVLANSSFEAMEQEFPELPALLYDGPFSQHLTSQSPKHLAGREPVDEQEARRVAGHFLDRDPSQFSLSSVSQGQIPSYGFSLDTEEENVWMEVSRQGGAVVELLISRLYGPAQLVEESGLSIARDFLAERNFPQMRESYTIRSGSLFTVSFAYVQDEVLCYPDLVKVTVALDTGEVVGFEAHGYLNQHTQRTIPAPAVPESTARQAVAPELTVLAHQLTLIPTAGQGEVFCHEFKCQATDGSHVLVYVNAITGAQEKILLLLEDENGTLVL